MSKPYIIICDIDGTIADCNHRRPHLDEKPKNWKDFNGKMHLDAPVKPLVRLLDLLSENEDVRVLCVSGREEVFREVTQEWLNVHRIAWDELFMRKKADYRDDQIIKQEILNEITEKYGRPDIVFEDRQRVVDMWRANGIFCCQVDKGNF